MNTPVSSQDCPSAQTLAALAGGTLSEEASRIVHEHEDSCVSCMKRKLEGSGTGTGSVSGERTPALSAAPGLELGLAATLKRGSTLGRYTVLEKLGEGGMGMVFAAYDAELSRKVALKLLSSAHDAEARARLLREAQAMAKLAHPNVVAIHDVTTHGEDVVMVMEFVDGTTLRGWRKQQSRPWRESLRVLLAAGEGLAAAHAAGLVHRDFKPDNVLVGNDGRTRVTDFGIARAQGASDDARDAPDAAVTPSSGSLSLEMMGSLAGPSLTRVGSVVGTPAYMAPEQFDGTPGGPLSDQYSFAVTLYEALTGARPFGGGALKEHLELARAEKYQPLPAQDATPAWLLRTVRRALSPSPADRYPSMTELLSALRKDPSVRRARMLYAGAALLLALCGAGYFVRERNVRVRACEALPEQLVGVWDAATRAKVETAFSATHLSYASNALRTVERALDAQSKDWAQMRVDACLATHVRKEQSENVLALRNGCLDEKMDELRALSTLFQGADARTVQRAGQVTEHITPILRCGDVSSLLAKPKLPADAATRARIKQFETQLAQASVLFDAGKYPQCQEQVTHILADDAAKHYLPVRARSEAMLGNVLYRSGQADLARQHASDALASALDVGDDSVAADGAYQVAEVELEHSHSDVAKEWLKYTLALARRAGDPATLMRTYTLMGGVEAKLGHRQAALEGDRKAVELAERYYGAEGVATVVAHYNMHIHETDLGDYQTSVRGLEQSLRAASRVLGDEHPLVIFSQEDLVENYASLGMLSHTEALVEKLEGEGRAHGAAEAQTFLIAEAKMHLASALISAGEYERGGRLLDAVADKIADDPEGSRLTNLRYLKAKAFLARGDLKSCAAALAENARIVGNKRPLNLWPDAAILGVRAGWEARQGHPKVALQLRREATALMEKALGPTHPWTWRTRMEQAAGELANGDVKAASALAEQALPPLVETFGEEDPDLAAAYLTLGNVRAALGHCDGAVAPLEHARALLAERPARTDLLGEANALGARCQP